VTDPPHADSGTLGVVVQVNVTPASVSDTRNDGDNDCAGDGGATTDGTGGAVVSNVYDADPAALVFPAASVAVTDSVYTPSGAPDRLTPVVAPHEVTVAGDGETEQVKLAVGSASVTVNDGERLFAGEAGALTSGGLGGVVSSRYDAVRAALTLPAASTAETETEYVPSVAALRSSVVVVPQVRTARWGSSSRCRSRRPRCRTP
jgi:hypothetical protein